MWYNEVMCLPPNPHNIKFYLKRKERIEEIEIRPHIHTPTRRCKCVSNKCAFTSLLIKCTVVLGNPNQQQLYTFRSAAHTSL